MSEWVLPTPAEVERFDAAEQQAFLREAVREIRAMREVLAQMQSERETKS